MILFPHDGGETAMGMHQIDAIRAAIRSDDRFVWVPVSQTAKAASHRRPVAEVLVRSSRQSRYVPGDEIAKLLENESIPQYLWPAAKPFADWMSLSGGHLTYTTTRVGAADNGNDDGDDAWRSVGVSHSFELEGKTILELGSGAGLSGFAAAATCSPQLVVLSDCSPVAIAMLQESVEHNERIGAIPRGRVRVAALKWGDDVALTRLLSLLELPRFEVVMGSDIFYFQNSFSHGLQTAYRALVEGSQHNRGIFMCSSFVRSQRMDDDIDQIPQMFGFQRQRVQLQHDDSRRVANCSGGEKDKHQDYHEGEEDGGLRLYIWTTGENGERTAAT
jgi:hypothetical protein